MPMLALPAGAASNLPTLIGVIHHPLPFFQCRFSQPAHIFGARWALCNGSMFNNTQRGANMLQTIFRLPSVKSETGLSRSTLYLRISQGLWPKPVSLGARAVGWPAHEVAALNAARIAGKTDEEI